MSDKSKGCAVKRIAYEPSDTVEFQGKQEKASKYQKRGYYVKVSRNGYWVMVKPSKVLVTLACAEDQVEVNLKQCILDYYEKKRISEKTIQKFAQQVEDKKIAVYPCGDWYEIRKLN